jgi:hypothetical protein
MSNATPSTTNRKRVKISEPHEDILTSNVPSKKAKDVFSDAVVSLLPAVKTLLEFFFNKIMKLRIDILHLKIKIDKLEQGSSIPKSARSNFSLTSKNIESDAKQQLLMKVDELKTNYQNTLKETILANMNLDLDALYISLKNVTCDAFYKVVQIYMIIQNKKDELSDEETHTHVLEIVRKTQHCLQYSFTTGYDEFDLFYKNKYNLPMMSVELDDTTATDISVLTDGEEASLAFARSIGQTHTIITRDRSRSTTRPTPTLLLTVDNINIIRGILYNVFAKPWAAYIHEHDQRILNSMLTKYTTTVLATESTNEASAILANEPTADQKLLKDLIASEVSKATKGLQSKLNTLAQSNQRSAKNDKRGAAKSPKRADKKKSVKSRT